MLIKVFPGYLNFLKTWSRYSKLKGAESIKLIDTYPCIAESTQTTPFDRQYFYQDIWAFKKILQTKTPEHTDIGSSVSFVGILSSITKVTFIDIRPIEVNLNNFQSKKGSVLAIPFKDDSIFSLSCLHVAEHIGLGRYGDPLDPLGTQKACRELARVVAKGGNLYFSLPVGKPRVCFNAHRIHSPSQILEYFNGLKLIQLACVDDNGNFIGEVDPVSLGKSDYACGLFHFTKN